MFDLLCCPHKFQSFPITLVKKVFLFQARFSFLGYGILKEVAMQISLF